MPVSLFLSNSVKTTNPLEGNSVPTLNFVESFGFGSVWRTSRATSLKSTSETQAFWQELPKETKSAHIKLHTVEDGRNSSELIIKNPWFRSQKWETAFVIL
jgi:hypothetical protein